MLINISTTPVPDGGCGPWPYVALACQPYDTCVHVMPSLQTVTMCTHHELVICCYGGYACMLPNLLLGLWPSTMLRIALGGVSVRHTVHLQHSPSPPWVVTGTHNIITTWNNMYGPVCKLWHTTWHPNPLTASWPDIPD